MDNCSIHHVAGITEIIEEVGAMVHFLPPYSPDLNPIEFTFSKVKGVIKDFECSMVTENTEALHFYMSQKKTARTGFHTVDINRAKILLPDCRVSCMYTGGALLSRKLN